MRISSCLFLILISLLSCQKEASDAPKTGGFTDGSKTRFSKVTSDRSGIKFQNTIQQDLEFNFMSYPYIFVGAGIAVGDIDNDGLEDLYFSANFGPNKLYKNKGNFQFEDITTASRTEDFDGFATGVTMLDVNNDGWLDIYVSKAGSLGNDNGRRNKLFVNQRDGTFQEEANKWGLDDPGFTTQAYPFDYDNDGDLDLYLVNYRYDFYNNTKISGAIQSQIEEITSDQLYRNDGNRFTKVTGAAGLYNKTWGLAATIGDFNNDGWDDIYVSNDFIEPDQLYINQQDGTFKNEINKRIQHISFNSMGSDYADLNNDLHPDLITLDMLAENYARSKENMASMSTENFMTMVDVGYHHAYMANMLHYNLGNGYFQETSQISGVVKTDWSWAPLLADLDNDGLKDIYITNGVFKDYTNQDFRTEIRARNMRGESMTLDAVMDMLPAQKLDNYVYQNTGNMSFKKVIKDWGLVDPGFSSGGAYADLDNDGDLDLITSNVNSEIGLYQNHTNTNYIQIALNGPSENPLALGTRVYLETQDGKQYQRQFLTRGFQSSISPVLHFGLGDQTQIDRIVVEWPDGKTSIVDAPSINSRLDIDHEGATGTSVTYETANAFQLKDAAALGLNYEQNENEFNDFSLQLLIPQKQSTKGSKLAVGDVNGDGLDDFYVGNALGSAGALFLQQASGNFQESNVALWRTEAKYEDGGAAFFDADGDGDLDLYVSSTGYELPKESPLLQDRLYLNDGNGNFSKASQALPEIRTATKTVAVADYDGDGDMDLFVGGNVVPAEYPRSPRSFLLQNDGGRFTDATASNASLMEVGMVSEALFTDYDGDQDPDLLLVGEWMQPTFFNNNGGQFQPDENITGLENTSGWWFAAHANDFDGDGDLDYVLGNLGKNNKFQPKQDKPIYIYGKDFDDNGSFDVALSKINEGKLVPVRGKECSSEQNPFLLDKIKSYKEFASMEFKDIYGEDRLKGAMQLTAHMFESVYLQNDGNGAFTVLKLPAQAQIGPTLSIVSEDINGDGNPDILGIGAIYDAEVETIRYDSNFGYVLLGDGAGGFEHSSEYRPVVMKDSKDVKQIAIDGQDHYLVLSNNSGLDVFTFQP